MAYALLSKEELIKTLADKDAEIEKLQKATILQIHPTIPPPDPWNLKTQDISESFEDFMLHWEIYQTASSLNTLSDITKVAIFWSALGSQGIRKCQRDWKFSDADKASVTIIIQKIRDKLKSQRLPLIDRVKFAESIRDDQESITEFVRRVESLAEHCNYGQNKDEMILQQVLKGLKDHNFQKELLSVDNLTWALAKQKISAKNACDSQLVVLQTVKSESSEVKKITKSRIRCRFCATDHKYGSKYCPAFGKDCSYCGIRNHSSKACRKKKVNSNSSDTSENESKSKSEKSRDPKKFNKKTKDSKAKDVKKVQAATSNSESDNEWWDEVQCIRRITCTNMNASRAHTQLKFKIQGETQSVNCLIDTGSDLNVIGMPNLKKLIPEPQLRKSIAELQDIQNKKIEVLGQTSFQCIHEGKKFELKFHVVDFELNPILAEQTCHVMRLIEYPDQSSKEQNSHPSSKENHAERLIQYKIQEAEKKKRELDRILSDLRHESIKHNKKREGNTSSN